MVLTGEGKDDCMTPRTTAPEVEIVVVASNQAATLEPSVRRLHAHLTDAHAARFPALLARDDRRPRVDRRHRRGRRPIGRRARRGHHGASAQPTRPQGAENAWHTSDASVAAFVTLAPDDRPRESARTARSSHGRLERRSAVRDDTARRPSGGGWRGARRFSRRVRWQRLVVEQCGDVRSGLRPAAP